MSFKAGSALSGQHLYQPKGTLTGESDWYICMLKCKNFEMESFIFFFLKSSFLLLDYFKICLYNNKRYFIKNFKNLKIQNLIFSEIMLFVYRRPREASQSTESIWENKEPFSFLSLEKSIQATLAT